MEVLIMFTPTQCVDLILALETRMTEYYTTHPIGKLIAPVQRPLCEAMTFLPKLMYISLERSAKKHTPVTE